MTNEDFDAAFQEKKQKEADELMERYLGKELNDKRKESVWVPDMFLQMRIIELLEEQNELLKNINKNVRLGW